jgi:hypothetical protein
VPYRIHPDRRQNATRMAEEMEALNCPRAHCAAALFGGFLLACK